MSRQRMFKVELWDDRLGQWYSLDEYETFDIIEAMASFERYVSFGRVSRITGWLGPDVESE